MVVDEKKNGVDSKYSPSEATIVKWAQFLTSLPWRFPNVSARVFLTCASAVLTKFLRDISIIGGEGFGAWWVIRCWIDEYLRWIAELEGFGIADESLISSNPVAPSLESFLRELPDGSPVVLTFPQRAKVKNGEHDKKAVSAAAVANVSAAAGIDSVDIASSALEGLIDEDAGDRAAGL
jgi:hypothetical protein